MAKSYNFEELQSDFINNGLDILQNGTVTSIYDSSFAVGLGERSVSYHSELQYFAAANDADYYDVLDTLVDNTIAHIHNHYPQYQ